MQALILILAYLCILMLCVLRKDFRQVQELDLDIYMKCMITSHMYSDDYMLCLFHGTP